MESDLFLKSSFFNNFEEFSLEIMNRKKKKKESNLSPTRSFVKRKKVSRLNLISDQIKKKLVQKESANVKINLSPRPFHNSSAKLHNVPDPSILHPPHPFFPT